jgi:hypothetical protein
MPAQLIVEDRQPWLWNSADIWIVPGNDPNSPSDATHEVLCLVPWIPIIANGDHEFLLAVVVHAADVGCCFRHAAPGKHSKTLKIAAQYSGGMCVASAIEITSDNNLPCRPRRRRILSWRDGKSRKRQRKYPDSGAAPKTVI